MAVLPIYNVTRAETVTFDTTPYWPPIYGVVGSLGNIGPTTTMGETFIAPDGGNVALNDFTFYCHGNASLYLQAFVFQWSGTGTSGDPSTTGNPLYLSSTFIYSAPPNPVGWAPLTVNLGATGVNLIPNDVYVMGITLSNPTNWAASSGELQFQNDPSVTIPASASGGGAAYYLNNGNDFSALTNSNWGGGAPLSFTAHLTVVPEKATESRCWYSAAFSGSQAGEFFKLG